MTSRPVGQERHCSLVVDLHPGHVKNLTGTVTMPHEGICVPQRLSSLRNIYAKGGGSSFVLEDENFLPEGG